MVNILVAGDVTKLECGGTHLELIIELQLATVSLIDQICKEAPEGAREILCQMYIDTLQQAFEFKE